MEPKAPYGVMFSNSNYSPYMIIGLYFKKCQSSAPYFGLIHNVCHINEFLQSLCLADTRFGRFCPLLTFFGGVWGQKRHETVTLGALWA